ncbi:MAG TPA: hypothetical protein VF043_35485 [Ktedonobacteraceae bacterium]
MNQLYVRQKTTESLAASSTMTTRLTGPWLIIARVTWLVLIIFSLGFLVASFLSYYQQLQTACVGPIACNIAGALPAKGFHELLALGLSASEYAAFNTIFWGIDILIWGTIGFLIFLRRSDDWLALLAAFTLVIFNTEVITSSLVISHPALTLPITLMDFLGQLSLVLLFLLFPNGRFVPRWMGLVALLGVLQAVTEVAPATSPLSSNNVPAWVNGLFALIIYGSVIFSQIYRYRRVSTPAQRQQTKWVVFGMIVIVAGFIVLAPLFSALGINQAVMPYADFLGFAYPLLLLLLPICTCIAILRYRLYDIDTLINRALVYSLLTGMLVVLYAGLTIGLESLVGLLTRQPSQPVIIVISTLAIAALFQPLRHRIQNVIDRRFYRRKYNAQKILQAFSATLRSEIDLNQLSGELLTVVNETMQPAHVSLWLRSSGRFPEASPEQPQTMEEGF